MSPKDVIRLFRTRAWQQTCLAGAPVPDEHVCAALHCTSQALTELKVGDTARITCLDAAHSSIATKLAAMGILPGTRIRLINVASPDLRHSYDSTSESAADSGQEKKTSSRQTVVARTSSHAPAEPDSGSAGAVRDASIFALAQLDGLPAECIAESFSIETKDVHEVVGRIALLLRRENREDVTSAIRKAGSLTEKS